MEHGAIDLHKKESQVRIVTESGEVIDQRIRTTRDRLTALFWGRPHARILIEASTESEWVAQHLETEILHISIRRAHTADVVTDYAPSESDQPVGDVPAAGPPYPVRAQLAEDV